MLRKERIYTLGALALIWGGLLFFSGAVSPDYHFADDHEIIRFAQRLIENRNSFGLLVSDQVSADAAIRFRPLYYLHRITACSIFGVDFTLWHLYHMILAIFSSFLLFLFARRIGFRTREGAVFSLLPFFGEQAEIWWRLGPAETIGVVMLALAIYFMGRSAALGGSQQTNTILFVLFAALASLSKESLILCIPALVLWDIALHKHHAGHNWPQAIRYRLPVSLFLLLIVSVELLYVLLFVGKADIGYAGVDRISAANFFRTAKGLFTRSGFGATMFLGLLIVAICSRGGRMRIIKQLGMPAALLFLMTLPQIVLYAKSGLAPRYHLPAAFGISIFSAYLLQYARLDGISCCLSRRLRLGLSALAGTIGMFLLCLGGVVLIRPSIPVEISSHILGALLLGASFLLLAVTMFKRSDERARIAVSKTLLFLFSIVFVFNIGVMFAEAKNYALDGRDITRFMSALIEKSSESVPVLIVADPALHYESVFSTRVYLDLIGNRKDLYVVKSFVRNGYSDFEQHLIGGFDTYARGFGMKIADDQNLRLDFHCIGLLPGTEKVFHHSSADWFNPKSYDRLSFGPYTLYARP